MLTLDPHTTARCAALVIAAAASGQGKTTVTAALARLHARQGRRVRVFKCGPDYLDPYWHEQASGATVEQLDLWMTGIDDCAQRLYTAAREADLILVEGVMGLFDGEDCVADLAQRFHLPVLAVVDAAAMGGTLGAIAFGLRHFRPNLPWAGVLANRVASAYHAQLLQQGLQDPTDWLGALPRLGDSAGGKLLPERHLGLVAAHELPDALQRLDAAADALAHTPLGQMDAAALQRFAVDFAPPIAPASVPPLLAGRTVAVAHDAAFCFIYPANVQTLEQLGARVVYFSPVAGDRLPACDAVWLPGGYPELHLPRLQAATLLVQDLRAHVAAGKALWAECGGLMALAQSITLPDGTTHTLWGLLPGHVTLQRRLAALGAQQWAVGSSTPSGETLHGVLRGHTFHYSTVRVAADCTPLTHTTRARPNPAARTSAGEAIYRLGSLQASYFHPWFASSPTATAALFRGQVS